MASSSLVALTSPSGALDSTDLGNIATNQVIDELRRVPGVGDVMLFGSGYAMRIWLDPDALASYNLSPGAVLAAIREQNSQTAGGAIGALGRHFVSAYVMRLAGAGFPWGTVSVNVIGSFVMGALIEVMALRWNVSNEMRAFMTVGCLGAFTTFSTFSLDFATLFERGAGVAAVGYVAVSVVASILALFGGLALMRVVLS